MIFEFSGPFYPRVVISVGKREILIFHSFPPCGTKTGTQNEKGLSKNPFNIHAGALFNFWGVVRVGGQGWGDNSIQFINIGRVGDKIFKE